MNLHVKPAAVEQLGKETFTEGEGIRIESHFVGSCSISSRNALKIDQKQEADRLVEKEGIPFLLSEATIDNLHEDIFLDYNPAMGFKLSTAEEVYQYNLKLERGSKN